MNNKISNKDKKDWEDFVSGKEKLPNKDLNERQNQNKKKKLIDLHGFTLEEANKCVEKFITKSYNDNISKLIIVTGKGLHSENDKNPYISKDLSILKYSVPDFITKNQNLIKVIREITDADIEDGGSGAFYIYLKKKKNIKLNLL